MTDTYKIKVIKADTGEVVKTLEADTERKAAFEKWLAPTWSRATVSDAEGDIIYVEDWVQGAWVAFCEFRGKAPAHPAEGVPACPKPQNPHYDYLKKYWQDGFDGMELVACMGDKPLKAWHDGKSARSAYDAAQGTGVPAPAVDALDAKDRECLAIGQAVNRAALELPADGDIRIEIENGAGVVYVYEPKYGDWRYIDSGEVFSAQINEAIDSAIAAQAKAQEGAQS